MSNWQTGEHFMRKYTEDEKFMKEAIKQAKKAEEMCIRDRYVSIVIPPKLYLN